uniref:Rho GTPase activating protein 9 n=1 Tax=Sinocyclocheilus rhinocerous TaxID=307959 RepID=A0A673H0E2_9TELE
MGKKSFLYTSSVAWNKLLELTSLSVSDHGTRVVSLWWCPCPTITLRVSLRGTMLSGSWRRGTVISGSRLGSTVVLEAQYDYSYRAVDGHLVSIHEGERFLLLKKTNADWWQVRRIGVGAKVKPIYVPATYVIELPISQFRPSLPSSQSASESFKMIPRGSLTPCMQTHGSGRFPTLPLSGSSASPSGHLSVPGPPKPLPGQRPLQTLQLWDQYCDPGTGRCYYVNTVTEERSWKPPRRARESHAHQNKVSDQSDPGTSDHGPIRDVQSRVNPKSQNPDSWKPGNSRPESSVDLRGAQLQWANDLSSRKNVFKVRTRQKSDFILQENVSNSAQVCETLKYAIKYQELSILFPERSICEKVNVISDKENPLDNVLRVSCVSYLHGPSAVLSGGSFSHLFSAVPRSTSNLESSEHKRVKSRLKKLILRRPPLQTLQEKGLIKDQVFGCGLELLCEREKSSVPQFVRKCTDAVERRGLETDGIYRVSGNLAVIQKLRFAVNHERAVTTDGRYLFPEDLVQERLDLDDPQWEDIHVITGALKLFFRELPEPLVPYGFFHDVVETVSELKLLVLSMPPHNQHTLQHMIQHLRRVMERSDSNRMTTQNIGIVFGPTLMRPENESGNMAINMVYQNQAVELLLSEYQRIFRTEQTGSY